MTPNTSEKCLNNIRESEKIFSEILAMTLAGMFSVHFDLTTYSSSRLPDQCKKEIKVDLVQFPSIDFHSFSRNHMRK